MKSNRKYLLFQLAESRYAIETKYVAEVADLAELSVVPRAPLCCMGAFNFHGDIIAAIDLPLLLGLSEKGAGGKSIVINPEYASMAFVVDSVSTIISESEILSTQQGGPQLASSVMSFSDGNAVELDLDKVISAVEHYSQKQE